MPPFEKIEIREEPDGCCSVVFCSRFHAWRIEFFCFGVKHPVVTCPDSMVVFFDFGPFAGGVRGDGFVAEVDGECFCGSATLVTVVVMVS